MAMVTIHKENSRNYGLAGNKEMSLPLRYHLHMLKFLYRKSQSFCKKYIISLKHCNVYWKFCSISYTSSICFSALSPLPRSVSAYSINFCRAAAALFCGAPYPQPVSNNKMKGRGEQTSHLLLPESQKGSMHPPRPGYNLSLQPQCSHRNDVSILESPAHHQHS